MKQSHSVLPSGKPGDLSLCIPPACLPDTVGCLLCGNPAVYDIHGFLVADCLHGCCSCRDSAVEQGFNFFKKSAADHLPHAPVNSFIKQCSVVKARYKHRSFIPWRDLAGFSVMFRDRFSAQIINFHCPYNAFFIRRMQKSSPFRVKAAQLFQQFLPAFRFVLFIQCLAQRFVCCLLSERSPGQKRIDIQSCSAHDNRNSSTCLASLNELTRFKYPMILVK